MYLVFTTHFTLQSFIPAHVVIEMKPAIYVLKVILDIPLILQLSLKLGKH